MLFQFHRSPAQLGGVRAGLEELLQITEAILAGGCRLVARLRKRVAGGAEARLIIELACELLGSLHIKIAHLAPTVFELGNVGRIEA